jgi:hypothetical protein
MGKNASATYLLLDGAGGSVRAAEVGSRGRVVARHLLAVLAPLVAVFDGEGGGVGGVDPGADPGPGDLDSPARGLVGEGALGGMVGGLAAVARVRRRLQAVPAPLPAAGVVVVAVVAVVEAPPRDDLAAVQVGDRLGEPPVLLADLGEPGLQGPRLLQTASSWVQGQRARGARKEAERRGDGRSVSYLLVKQGRCRPAASGGTVQFQSLSVSCRFWVARRRKADAEVQADRGAAGAARRVHEQHR